MNPQWPSHTACCISYESPRACRLQAAGPQAVDAHVDTFSAHTLVDYCTQTCMCPLQAKNSSIGSLPHSGGPGTDSDTALWHIWRRFANADEHGSVYYERVVMVVVSE